MKLHDFDALPDHLAVAACVVRFADPIDVDAVRTITQRMAAAHVFDEVTVEMGPVGEMGADGTCYLVGAWIPRTAEAHVAAIAQLRTLADHGAQAAWFFGVTTTIDALADDDDASETHDDDVSHWRHGPPPAATATAFPCDGYPEILDAFDGDDFGFAVKLAAPPRPGELAVLRALHGLWIAAYVDRRVEERPFRNAAVAFDPVRRAAIWWVDEFGPPATIAQMVHHLLWAVSALHAIVPVAHGRFVTATMEQKYGELMDDAGPPFVLAGNPLRAMLAQGDAAAAAWARDQELWSPIELAAMYVEAGTDLDPDDGDQAAIAVARFDAAAALDPSNAEAGPYAQVALVRGGRVDLAVTRALAGDAAGRAHTLTLVAEHAPQHLRPGFALLDAATLAAVPDEQTGDLLVAVANASAEALPGQRHAIDGVLRMLRPRAELVAPVFNASFRCDDATMRLMLLEFVLDLPIPAEGTHRDAFTYAHNNACVLAHQLGDFARAAALADRAQPYAEENPYIFHGAACAYFAVGRTDDAMAQIERAIARDYDHLDKLEVDEDLGELRERPAFVAMFAARRDRLARSEPVRAVTTADFAATVLAADVPVLVDFTASWCGPCKRQAPILERLAHGSEGRFRVVAVDIDDNPELAERYDATSVPTLVVFHGGRECGRRVGLSQRAQLDALLHAARRELN